ncbi:MAG: TauD/TfdA family dioxygenase [Magnetococcales bacterium]|nr:TauD/TfdA family dioxygenase [Magnetococcales bacterium]
MTTPFHLGDDARYQAWKQAKLQDYPTSLTDLLVEIVDPEALTTEERAAILSRCHKSNMALFRLRYPERCTNNPLPAITAQLGIKELDHNLGAGEDGLSALTPGGSAYDPFAAYIPYRAAAIGWHTDGYYNPADHQVQSLCLYCERPAHTGGENELLDHELVYMQLRDRNPAWVATLLEPDVMTIPARFDAQGAVARPERTGPVFSITAEGALHTRFTNRTKSIRWRDDEATRQAVEAFRQVLQQPSPYLFRGQLARGWGLISNNVLHTRNAFSDPAGQPVRVLYRARYFDRLPAA